MIHSDSVAQKTVGLRVLTDDQIAEIKRAAFDVMWRVGFKVLHQGARDMLKQAGARVKGEIVTVPEHIVNACLNTTPKGWTIYDREGQRAMEVEGRKSYYGTSTASPNTKDALTGEIHPTRVADIAIGAKVADALEHIDWVMPMGSVQDVPATAADLYEFEAVVTNTTKPIVFIGYTPRGVELVYKMAMEVATKHGLVLKRPPPEVFFIGFGVSDYLNDNERIYLPEERKQEGIFPLLSIAENTALPGVPVPALPATRLQM